AYDGNAAWHGYGAYGYHGSGTAAGAYHGSGPYGGYHTGAAYRTPYGGAASHTTYGPGGGVHTGGSGYNAATGPGYHYGGGGTAGRGPSHPRSTNTRPHHTRGPTDRRPTLRWRHYGRRPALELERMGARRLVFSGGQRSWLEQHARRRIPWRPPLTS